MAHHTHSDSEWETDEWEVLSVSSNTTSTASTLASSWEEVSHDTLVLEDDTSGHKRKLLEIIEEESDYVYDSDDDAPCANAHNTVYDEKYRLTRALVDSALEAGPPPFQAKNDETLAHELASVDKSEFPSSRIDVDQELALALQDEEETLLIVHTPQQPSTNANTNTSATARTEVRPSTQAANVRARAPDREGMVCINQCAKDWPTRGEERRTRLTGQARNLQTIVETLWSPPELPSGGDTSNFGEPLHEPHLAMTTPSPPGSPSLAPYFN